MKRSLTSLWAVPVLTLVLSVLSGCGPQGEDGDSYMSLDWVYAPRYIDIPMLPSVVVAKAYYEHPDGYYDAAYIAWDGSYWVFQYRIEIDRGSWGFLDIPGADGADRYYTMQLYSWGPELTYMEVWKSLSGLDAEEPASRERSRAEELGVAPSRERSYEESSAAGDEPVDISLYDTENPHDYTFETGGPGYRITIQGKRYSPLE
jgi:hypothetical protein